MSGKVIITTPFPTPDEIAAYLRIPAKRVAELNRMIAEVREADCSPRRRKNAAPRNNSRRASTGSKASRSKTS